MTSKRRESGTRLPYPTGDYASLPDMFYPSNSPPSSTSSAMRPLSTTSSGLPFHSSSGLGTLAGVSYSTTSLSSLSSSGMGAGRPLSPPAQPNFVSASATLNRTAAQHPTSKRTRRTRTATPEIGCRGAMKRYTVAFGGPIIAPPDEDEFSSNAASTFYVTAANTNTNANATNTNTHTDPPAPSLKRVGTPRSFSRVIGGSVSLSPVGDDDDDDKEEEGDGEFGEGEETIGKSSGIKLRNANGSVPSTSNNSISPGGPGGGDYKSTATTPPSPSTRRIRAQSARGYASLLPPQTQTPTMVTTVPLKPKLRACSSERLSSGTHGGTGDGMISSGFGRGTKFVDPLLLRRQQQQHQQSQEGLPVKMPMPKPVGNVPIGQLVAFFDGEKGGRT